MPGVIGASMRQDPAVGADLRCRCRGDAGAPLNDRAAAGLARPVQAMHSCGKRSEHTDQQRHQHPPAGPGPAGCHGRHAITGHGYP
ncbi:Uncharacterised protein [Mycobacteroides abscessus subsp. abscessus]|nr:Uncharacterised protein [Mycobacteroides abscessus subsp. abscessus]